MHAGYRYTRTEMEIPKRDRFRNRKGSGELAGLPEEEAREKYRNSPGAVGPALRVGRGFCGQGSLYDRCLPSPNPNQRLYGSPAAACVSHTTFISLRHTPQPTGIT
jgi:hypothetical protein